MDLTTLVDALASSTNGLPLVIDERYCTDKNIHLRAASIDFYVEPEISGPDQLAPILLVSAPAAVGKTTLARYLHSQLAERGQGVLYVPLQNAGIGDDFFAGRLSSVFPELGKRSFLDAVFSGQIILLFDGYDEVTMGSDQIEHNRRFVSEILRELEAFESRQQKARPSIVFLYRSVFAEYGMFDPIGDRASQISVRFFDQPRRKRFLKQYLDFKAKKDPERPLTQGHLAGDFLDGFERLLPRARDEAAAAFFGHAIVLCAFGDFLYAQDAPNSARLAESLLDKGAAETTSVDLLSHIIRNILEREVRKFPDEPYSRHIPNFDGYSVSIQEKLLQALAEVDLLRQAGESSDALDRAIGEILHALKQSPGFIGLEESRRESFLRDYRRELTLRITHHPFSDLRPARGDVALPQETAGAGISKRTTFRNPVYREFYLARLIASDAGRSWDVLTRANDVSHYLALFFLHRIPDRDLSKFEAFLFHFISLLATSSSGDDFLFRFAWNAGDQTWHGTVDAPYLRVEPFFFASAALTVTLPRLGVLQNVAFVGDDSCMIEIGGPGPEHAYKEPIILRDCVLKAGEVSIAAPATRFENVTITTATLRVSDRSVNLEGLDHLTITSNEGAQVNFDLSAYGRSRWAKALNDAVKIEPAGEALFRQKLGKLLLWFRRHHRTEYGCYDKKFQTCGLSNNQDGLAMDLANFLFSTKLLTQNDSLIVMNQKTFANFDIYYTKQNALQFGDRATNLFGALIASPFGAAFR